jgi:hypothetical protein
MKERKPFLYYQGGGCFKCDESCLKNGVGILARDNVERKKPVVCFLGTVVPVLLKKVLLGVIRLCRSTDRSSCGYHAIAPCPSSRYQSNQRQRNDRISDLYLSSGGASSRSVFCFTQRIKPPCVYFVSRRTLSPRVR